MSLRNHGSAELTMPAEEQKAGDYRAEHGRGLGDERADLIAIG